MVTQAAMMLAFAAWVPVAAWPWVERSIGMQLVFTAIAFAAAMTYFSISSSSWWLLLPQGLLAAVAAALLLRLRESQRRRGA